MAHMASDEDAPGAPCAPKLKRNGSRSDPGDGKKRTVPDCLLQEFRLVRDDREAQWSHIARNPLAQSRAWLEAQPGLDGITIDALTNQDTRPRVVIHQDEALVILRGVNTSEGADPADMVSLRIHIRNDRVISVQLRHVQAVLDVVEAINQGRGVATPGDWLVAIITALLSNAQPVIDVYAEGLSKLEDAAEAADADPAGLRSECVALRRQAVKLRRYLAPQNDAVRVLIAEPLSWLSKANDRRLTELSDRLGRMVDELDEMLTRSALLMDNLTAIQANRTNIVTTRLSILAAVFLPMTLISGMLGMNVGGIPGAGISNGFWLTCALLSGLGLVTLAFLKWRRML